MELFTKREVAEIAIRPVGLLELPIEITNKIIDNLTSKPNYKFIRIARKSTSLNFCVFSEDKYFIRYN